MRQSLQSAVHAYHPETNTNRSGRPSSSVFRRLLPYLHPYRWKIALGVCLLLLSTPLGSAHPLIWKQIVDDVIGHHHPNLLAMWLLIMFVLQAIATLLDAGKSILLERVGQRFVFDLRNAIYAKLQRQSLAYMHEHRIGDLIARAMSDVDVLQEVAFQSIDAVIGNTLSFLVVVGILIGLNWKLGLATLLPIVAVFFLTRFFNARVKALYRQARDRLGEVNARLQENLTGLTLIKAFAKERYEASRFRAVCERYLQTNYRAIAARNTFFPAVRFIGFFSNVISIGYGGWLVLHGQFTIGGLLAYRGYWWQLFSPINSLATINELLQRANAAGARVFELLDAPESLTDAPDAKTLQLSKGESRVEFQHVSFAYGAKPTLRDVSFVAEPGQMVALVGPSGAGKTTVLNLIPRFWDVTAGRILINGQDVRQVTQESLRQHMAMVLQETFLFNGTILDNIRYGRPDAGMDQVESAARAANAHDFICELPKGYETEIGERGVKLSGGQRQRLSIARAFLANPEILILDEPTSSVEPESEAIITQALERLMQGRTTFVTSHRFSIVRNADQILVFESGRLVEKGRHAELLAQGGLYAQMYTLQMGYEAEMMEDARV
ncbi:MAG TPA: ABC transporter ATP-binding protein [Chthonomonadaceae bacterium]|nr:ABC transporter ATP-binding protein [Chthonomonadaceae bacterium]